MDLSHTVILIKPFSFVVHLMLITTRLSLNRRLVLLLLMLETASHHSPCLLHQLASSFRQDVYTFCTSEDTQYHSNLKYHLIFHRITSLIYSDDAVLTFLLFQAITLSYANTPSIH